MWTGTLADIGGTDMSRQKKWFAILFVLAIFAGMEGLNFHNHAWDVYAADPYQPGDTVQAYCGDCHANRNCVILDLLVPATCTGTGSALVQCTTCSNMIDATLPALGHDFKIVSGHEPTCTQPAEYHLVCSRCGATKEDGRAALGHAWSVTHESQPTCTAPGADRYICDRCGSSYLSEIPALGHNYQVTTLKAATCLEDGTSRYTCSRCGDSYTKTVPALGHDYKTTVEKEPTCEEEGLEASVCSRCGDRIEKVLDALGHDVEYEKTDATCTEDGKEEGVCKNCGELITVVIPALGHDPGPYQTVLEPTCTEKGREEAKCKRCGIVLPKDLEPVGHDYPEEWTLEKAPTIFAEGLESKTCRNCGDRITQTIPKKSPLPVIIAGGGGAAVLGGIAYYFYRKRRMKLAGNVANELFKPSFGTRSVLVVSENEELVKKLKGKKFLQVTRCEADALSEGIEENEPDLVLLDPCSEELLLELPALKETAESAEEETAGSDETPEEGEVTDAAETTGKTETEDTEEEEKKELRFALLMEPEIAAKNAALLETYRDEELITGVLDPDSKPSVVLTNLVLPILKPDVKSDESLSNIGAVADLLGIPVISAVLDAYVAGRDIKSVIEEDDEIGFSDASTIIGDIAGVLGFDTLAGAAGLTSDVQAIKDALDKEAGAYEHSEGKSAAEDIVDVVTDILD